MFDLAKSAACSVVLASLLALPNAASAQPVNVRGTSGYLSEWELSGEIADIRDGQGRSLTGIVIMKHTGLCSQDGPVEKTGQFHAKIVGSRPSARIDGVMVLNGVACTFTGPIAGRFNGAMDCPDAKGVPVMFTMQ